MSGSLWPEFQGPHGTVPSRRARKRAGTKPFLCFGKGSSHRLLFINQGRRGLKRLSPRAHGLPRPECAHQSLRPPSWEQSRPEPGPRGLWARPLGWAPGFPRLVAPRGLARHRLHFANAQPEAEKTASQRSDRESLSLNRCPGHPKSAGECAAHTASSTELPCGRNTPKLPSSESWLCA